MQSAVLHLAPGARPGLVARSSRSFTTRLPQRRMLVSVTRAEGDSNSEQAAQQVGAGATPASAPA